MTLIFIQRTFKGCWIEDDYRVSLHISIQPCEKLLGNQLNRLYRLMTLIGLNLWLSLALKRLHVKLLQVSQSLKLDIIIVSASGAREESVWRNRCRNLRGGGGTYPQQPALIWERKTVPWISILYERKPQHKNNVDVFQTVAHLNRKWLAVNEGVASEVRPRFCCLYCICCHCLPRLNVLHSLSSFPASDGGIRGISFRWPWEVIHRNILLMPEWNSLASYRHWLFC